MTNAHYIFAAFGHLNKNLGARTFRSEMAARRAWARHGAMDGRHSNVRLLAYGTRAGALDGTIASRPSTGDCLAIVACM